MAIQILGIREINHNGSFWSSPWLLSFPKYFYPHSLALFHISSCVGIGEYGHVHGPGSMTVEQTQDKEQASTSLEMNRKEHEQSTDPDMRAEGLSKALCGTGLKLLHRSSEFFFKNKQKPLFTPLIIYLGSASELLQNIQVQVTL